MRDKPKERLRRRLVLKKEANINKIMIIFTGFYYFCFFLVVFSCTILTDQNLIHMLICSIGINENHFFQQLKINTSII